MHKCSSIILYAACTFRPYKSTPVLKLFRTFTGKMTRGLSLQMVFSPLFLETLLTLIQNHDNDSPPDGIVLSIFSNGGWAFGFDSLYRKKKLLVNVVDAVEDLVYCLVVALGSYFGQALRQGTRRRILLYQYNC